MHLTISSPFHLQYPPLLGIPELRKAIASHSEREQGIKVDWENEVLVTLGATEAIAAAILGLCNPGDEVIFFDPCYDSYAPMARLAGAVVKPVKLSLPDFSLPREELTAAFSSKTKLILVNTPHNPSGKVFDIDELTFIADLCKKYDVRPPLASLIHETDIPLTLVSSILSSPLPLGNRSSHCWTRCMST